MFGSEAKKERKLGTPLFLKPHRGQGPKSAMVRRPHRPGQHGKSRRRAPSEFAEQLTEKQKLRFTYGLSEQRLRNVFRVAAKNPQKTGQALMELVERRLDNVMFRSGLALSRSIGRQLVNHGHVFVNGRRVKAPSYRVYVGDVVSIRPQSRAMTMFQNLEEYLMEYQAPAWLKIDPKKAEAAIVSMPSEFEIPFDISKVVDYYSKTVK